MYEKFYVTDNKWLMRMTKDANGKVDISKVREVNESDRRKFGIKTPPPPPPPPPPIPQPKPTPKPTPKVELKNEEPKTEEKD